MKITEIVPNEDTIVLGVFSTSTFGYISNLKNVYGYSKFTQWYKDEPDYINTTIVDFVRHACEIAGMIIFILDEVHFPINPKKSHTCRELLLICENDHFFDKTVFVKGENVIDFDKNLVLN